MCSYFKSGTSWSLFLVYITYQGFTCKVANKIIGFWVELNKKDIFNGIPFAGNRVEKGSGFVVSLSCSKSSVCWLHPISLQRNVRVQSWKTTEIPYWLFVYFRKSQYAVSVTTSPVGIRTPTPRTERFKILISFLPSNIVVPWLSLPKLLENGIRDPAMNLK